MEKSGAIDAEGLRAQIVRRVLAIVAGGIFAYAGWAKAFDPDGFAAGIENYRLVGRGIAVLLAFYLPWLEIFCGVVVAIGWCPLYRGAIVLCGAMAGVFLVALGSALARGLDIDCGCFGSAHRRGIGSELWLAAGLLLAAVALWRADAPAAKKP